jgi:hypothetical protein
VINLDLAISAQSRLGTVAGSSLLCQEVAPEWVLWARHVQFGCD